MPYFPKLLHKFENKMQNKITDSLNLNITQGLTVSTDFVGYNYFNETLSPLTFQNFTQSYCSLLFVNPNYGVVNETVFEIDCGYNNSNLFYNAYYEVEEY